MSTDVVQVPYEDSESGEQVTGTLRFHNTSGTVSWQWPGVSQPADYYYFTKEEVVAIAAAVLLWQGELPDGVLESIKGRNKGLLGDARIEGAGDHVLEAIDLLESPEQLRARFDALVESGLEREESAGGFSFAGERCPDCSAGWLGVAEPTSVYPRDTVGPAVVAVWMRDVRRAEAGEDVRGLYGWGMRLCPRHRMYGRQT